MGAWGIRHSGTPNAITPNIDRLCREGTQLTNHFSTSAVCSPSRACIITGRHCLEVGIPDFLANDENIGLDPVHMTIPKAFQAEGYNTGLVGKWHLGHADRFHPIHHGYDNFTGFRIGDDAGPLSSKDPVIEIDGRNQQAEGYTSDILADATIDFLTKNSNVPFFLSLHFWAPHANQGVITEDGDRTWHPLKDEDWSLFKDLEPQVPNPNYPKLDISRVKRMTREYLASIHSVDRNIGRVFETLEKQDRLDDTIIIFTSDNGFNLGHHGIWHKGNGWWILTDNQGDRPNLYDHSMRVPAIIRWPKHVLSGQCIDNPNTSMDWFPTLLEYAEIEAKPEWQLRGNSLKSALSGEQALGAKPIYGQYQMWDWNQTGADMRSYRTTEWKLMIDLKGTVPNEFYDLLNDPDETENLYQSKEPKIISACQRIEAELHQQRLLLET